MNKTWIPKIVCACKEDIKFFVAKTDKLSRRSLGFFGCSKCSEYILMQYKKSLKPSEILCKIPIPNIDVLNRDEFFYSVRPHIWGVIGKIRPMLLIEGLITNATIKSGIKWTGSKKVECDPLVKSWLYAQRKWVRWYFDDYRNYSSFSNYKKVGEDLFTKLFEMDEKLEAGKYKVYTLNKMVEIFTSFKKRIKEKYNQDFDFNNLTISQQSDFIETLFSLPNLLQK